jgi:DNA-directed RNA polymerase specialized sigma24 family protein
MTEKELQKHKKWLMQKYTIDGEDIFQQACVIALKRYETIENINQSLFGKICLEAARQLMRHHKHEIPFSCLVHEEADETGQIEFDLQDPEWERDFISIEKRAEIAARYGQWFLNLLARIDTEPRPSKVTKQVRQIKLPFL